MLEGSVIVNWFIYRMVCTHSQYIPIRSNQQNVPFLSKFPPFYPTTPPNILFNAFVQTVRIYRNATRNYTTYMTVILFVNIK